MRRRETMNIAEIKAYQDKVNAQLQEAKALLDGFEAHSRGKLAQSEIDAISRLKAKNQEIDKKLHHDLKAAGEVAIAAKVKADIDAEMAKFKTSVDQLAAKFKSQPVAH
jgi:predicted RNase H-like nuclease (RuvC/YqgF family)